MLRRVALFVMLCALGCGPALLVLELGRARPDIAPLLVGRAKAVAVAIDGRGALWRARCARLAREVGALLAQLDKAKAGATKGGKPAPKAAAKNAPEPVPEASKSATKRGVAPTIALGSAAEGTLMLHLATRLRAARDVAEYAVLDARGRLVLSTDGTREKGVVPAGFPEIAAAAERAVILVVDVKGRGQLVAAAPIKRAGTLRAVLAARLRVGARQLIPGGAPSRSTTVLVDADGRQLGAGHAAEALAALAARTGPGVTQQRGRVVAYAPLSHTRAAVIVSAAPAPARSLYRRWHLLLLGAVLVLSALGAWLLGRRR